MCNVLQVYRWDFDVLKYNRESNERPLSQLTLQLLEDQQLLVSLCVH